MFRRSTKSEFNKSVLTLLTGTTVAQAIPIAISPLLTRLYTPSDFGVLALFTTITVILGSIANTRYELAIILPKDEDEAVNLVALSIIVATLMSIVSFIIIGIFHSNIISLVDNSDIGFWLFMVPIVVFIIGVLNSFTYLNTRLKAYKNVAKANIYKSVLLAISQILFGVFKFGYSGLISGQILSNIVAVSKLGTIIRKENFKKVSRKEILRLAKLYSKFPKYSMWGILVNNLSSNLNTIFITAQYSISSLGYYSLTNRILYLPLSMISGAVGQVLYQKASEEINETGNCYKVTISTFSKLMIIALPLFLTIGFLVDDIITIVFGEDWKIAGEYAMLLMPLYFIRFVASPLSNVILVKEKQNIELIIHFGLLVSAVTSMVVTYYLNLNINSFLLIYSLLMSAIYILVIFISIKLSKNNVSFR